MTIKTTIGFFFDKTIPNGRCNDGYVNIKYCCTTMGVLPNRVFNIINDCLFYVNSFFSRDYIRSAASFQYLVADSGAHLLNLPAGQEKSYLSKKKYIFSPLHLNAIITVRSIGYSEFS